MAVLSWNEILQKDKQTQMTGAQGLSPEQLGALRSAELTEGAVNARNIFNQNEINRRNAVAEKQASDMMRANKSAQNMGAAIKLGTMATESYPQIKEAVSGAYNYITGAGASAYEGASAAYQGVSAANAAGLSTSVGNTAASEGVLALGETGTMGQAAANTGASAGGASVFAPYLGSAAAGYAAPVILNAIHEDSTENIGHNITFGAVRHEKTAAQVGSTATGAVAGAVAGAAATSWSGPGAIVGGVIGGLAGLASESCIIVTACTDRNSYEVEVTRQYRDKFLTKEHLVGYYYLAEKIVPKIENNVFWKYLTKKILVDNLIQYGKYKLGISEKASLLSKIITTLFLNQCKKTGKRIKTFTRCNGEIY